MQPHFLSDKIQYGHGYIILDVAESVPPLPKCIVDGCTLLPKTEYHCSLLATHRIARSVTSDEEKVRALEQAIVASVKAQLVITPIQAVRFTQEFYICKKDDKVTIIGLVDVPGLQEIRERVAVDMGVIWAPSVPHVTILKTANSRYGIGVNTRSDFDAFCGKLPPEIVQTLRRAFQNSTKK